ncbi:hypothetical protein PMN2A_1226 [Prochlorococcus marinus str. NATL2A]|uniref:Uncharacterized protein n=1 Tax=Prochlorococcus marinus (strain NATL2A) TaxID=59920 RepID=Q46IG2_PROMT|nr:hypothetical protein [Prochlorococcus marinus]AAZ58716.1 hypothetical protein PMN2A_1226 [Prochlorococcus marinus str. NATL2A]
MDSDGNAANGLNAATAVNVTGGNALSSFRINASDTLTATNSAVFDFSGYSGVITDLTFGLNDFDDGEAATTISVVGTANTDTVSASYDAATDASVTPNMTGIENFDISLADHGTEYVLDMSKASGLSQINVVDISSEKLELSSLASGVTVDYTTTDGTASELEIKLATVSGTESQTVNVSAASANDDLKITMADVETLVIKPETALQVDLDLSGLSMTATGATMAVNLTGTNDVEIISTAEDVTVIDASGMGVGGSVLQTTTRSSTAAATYTGSDGNDTFMWANSGDVIAAGAGTDTLDLNFAAILGGLNVDLTSTTNQIVSIDGSVPTGTVTGFEYVDLSGFTGSFGARITGLPTTANDIIGTPQIDVITAGTAADFITVAGGDTVNAGTGNDTFRVTDAVFDAFSVANPALDGQGGTGDILSITNQGTIVDADIVGISGIEILDFTTAASTATFGANFTASSITTIDQTGASLSITATAGQTLGSASAPIIITGYALNTEANILVPGGTATDGDGTITGYTVGTGAAEGVYTKNTGTATGLEFLAAAAAGTHAAGDVVAYTTGGDSFIFSEGANTNNSDDQFFQLNDTVITKVAVTHAAGIFHI